METTRRFQTGCLSTEKTLVPLPPMSGAALSLRTIEQATSVSRQLLSTR